MSSASSRFLFFGIFIIISYVFFDGKGVSGDFVCPDKTNSVGGTCYIIRTDVHKSWKDARILCSQTAGSDLLIVRNNEVINDIKNFILQNGGLVWIGASDPVVPGNFRWVDGSQCCSQMWTDNQPDNLGEERCVHFWKSGNKIGLNNYMCNKELPFICQFKASACPADTQQAGEICLRYHEGKYAWSTARTECQNKYGSDLLVVRNDDVFKIIQNAVKSRGDHGFWVGAVKQGNSFKWVDGTSCCGHYWNPGEPNGAQDSADNCVHVWDSGSAKGLNDVWCDDPIGFICEECPEIEHCKKRSCTNIYDTACSMCEDDNVFYKRTHSNTKCERMCSFDTHACWPGTCSDSLTSTCTCAPEFQKVTSSNETMCQLKLSTTPTINSCQTRIGGANGEAKRTTAGKCHKMNDFYGNFQPTALDIEMHSDFIVNITTLSENRPQYIEEENFGVTDTTVYVKKIQINGSETKVGTFRLKTDQNQSTDVTSTVSNQDTYTLSHPKYILKDGERLCVQYQAFGGGYMKRKDFRTNKVLDPLPYKKTSSEETVCYRYDDTKPQHCLLSVSVPCSNAETEPIQIAKRVIRNSIIPLEFTGWIDPLPIGGSIAHASGIETYEISVNEVVNGIVSTSKVFSQKLGLSNTSLILNLTSNLPRLYAINLEVKDVADNVQQARRFVLYDSNTDISSREDKPFFVSSASASSKYMWQTHHNDICLNWKDHFMNKFYMENSLLGEINPDPHGLITGIYEQQNGTLPVTGTPNVYGITEFRFSWSSNGTSTANTVTVPDPLNQSYCHSFSLKDGQTYTLSIEAIDIVNNRLSESRKVHIDRTVPHINNIWLTKNGVKRLYVHDDIDLSKMNLTFEAFDPHSGLLNIEWRFGIMDSGLTLGTGVIGIAILEKESCSNSSNDNCYCPDIGKCEYYKYSVPLNKLVPNNTHIGNHNRNYLFTLKVTNNAKLSNIEQIDVLVDDSPPERGVVYEGALESYDIDYTSDDNFIVRWHGFIDHESGIKEYRIGLSEVCLAKEELLRGIIGKNITDYRTVLFTESSIRLYANFTGQRFVSVIAVNNAMEESNVACSDGIIRDVNPPSIQNVVVENAKWAESIFCFDGKVWLLRSDLNKVLLSNSEFCYMHCKNGTTYDIHKLLPTEKSNISDTRIIEFLCNKLQTYDPKTITYLPNDDIFIRWDINESFSQIEDIYVGFGKSPANSSEPAIISYKSTDRKPFFHSRHLGIGPGVLFYANLKAVSKAKLETVLTIGPMMIDETPPYFKHKPVVSVSDDSLIVGWDNDTIYDLEQTETISKVLFQIVHDGMLVSPLLEWKFYDSTPCHGYTGGCLIYPLEKLQRIDTDFGLNFTVRMYAYNNAGHFCQIETNPFSIPSTYPPGHAVVLDIDPDRFTKNYQDVDVHFTPNKICSYWDGFRHHENVSIEIGLGTTKADANVIPFHQTTDSKRTCINSADIHFNIQYFVFLRASCSGGKTISTSNGILVINKTDFIQNIEINIGDSKDTNIAFTALGTETQQCSTENVQVGKPYKLRLLNVKENVSITSDDFLVNKRIYQKENVELDLYVIALVHHPCITIDSRSGENMSLFLQMPTTDGAVKSSKSVRVTWDHSRKELLSKMTFNIALVTMLDSTSSTPNITSWIRTNTNTSYSFDANTFNYERKYVVALMTCIRTNCLDFTLSKTFQIEHRVHPGEIQQSIIRGKADMECVNVSISWIKFKAVSNITLYQWSVSRDIKANVLLLDWKSTRNEGQNIFEVNECVVLPVHGHSTMFLCVRAYSEVGNVQTECQMASIEIETDHSRDTVYDIDMNASSWETIKEMIHSSNIGTHLSLLHNAEIDFGTVDATVAGVLLHAVERNVTWYLMKERKFPQSGDCDKDSDCVHSQISDCGFIYFDSYLVDRNCFYYICAYIGTTIFMRETFTEKFPEIQSCSNGFVIDDTPPTAGKISVKNTNGFLTDLSSLDIRWRGFDDNTDVEKLGYPYRIKYFSYAIGTHSGSTDIRNYTMVGNAEVILDQNVSFVEGTEVYVTVKATDHAGLSVTTTTNPLIVDSTPPSSGLVFINHGQKNIAYVSSSVCTVSIQGFKDNESGIAHFEIGLGSNKDANDIEAGLVHISDHFNLQLSDSLHDGHQYYVTVKAVNRANISGFPVSVSFVIDRTPPTGGHVIDGGWNITKDVDYQSSLGHIHGHWKGFIDPHSGIKFYRVGLGTRPRSDDIEDMVDVGLLTDVTWNGTYNTGQKFYITVQACNAAELCRTISSDGVLLDNTPPLPGVVRVGSGNKHKKYLPQSSSVHIQWTGFEDPHSGIDHYETCLGTGPASCDILPYSSSLLESSIIKTGLVLKSGVSIYATVTAYNKAGMNVTSASDSFQIDDTPPFVVQKPSFLFDVNILSGKKVQWEKSVLHMSWKFTEDESKIVSHIISLKTHHEGHTPVEHIHVGNVESLTLNLEENNWLHDGDTYYIVVTSCNLAGLCTSASSDNILIDSTPPIQGGFKSPLTFQNLINSENKFISRITVTWYGFADIESSIDEYYLQVSRNYSGAELSDGVLIRKANNQLEENATVTLSDKLNHDDILILSLWAKNNAGLNSTVSRVSVNVLSTGHTSSGNSFGILEIQKHSCDIHFCNKDCTCAILGKQCVEVEINDTCSALNRSHVSNMRLTEIHVFSGLPGNLYNITASSGCLAGHWKPLMNDSLIQRYEWSMGLKDQPVGDGIFDLKVEQPWRDVGKGMQCVHCLYPGNGLKHNTHYVIYVKAWYSKNMYATFSSDPILVDHTPPQQARGKFIKDSDIICHNDFDMIDWMDRISACWDGVFIENQGKIINYTVSLGTSRNGSDIFPKTHVGLLTNISLSNLTLSPGTKYFFTVTAYNNVGLHTTLSSDGFAVDMDIPVEGVVFNTDKHTDMNYQSSTKSFNISWHGFLDKNSGIRSFRVAIVEDSVKDYTNLNFSFINAGFQTKHIFRNLNLSHGKHYRGIVSATDNAGHSSTIVTSNRKMVDHTPPSGFSCNKFEAKDVKLELESNNAAFFISNLTFNEYYTVVGKFSNISDKDNPTISIGRKTMYLPIRINNNGSVNFEYSFLSQASGNITVSISATQVSNNDFPVVTELQLLRCSSLIHFYNDDGAVTVKQVGSSRLYVNCKIMDQESSLFKVYLGVGTTPGGFQIRTLTRLHGHTSGSIDVNVEHNTLVYITVIAENHAGLKSVFTADPLRIDKTPPYVSTIENNVSIDSFNMDTNVTGTKLNVRWKVAEEESRVTYCLCGLGTRFQGTDIVDLRLSDTVNTCLFNDTKLHHGNRAFISVKCINDVELGSQVISTEIIISTTAPIVTDAKVHIISNRKLWNDNSFTLSTDQLSTFAVTDRSSIRIEWSGFQDPVGLKNYEYRIMDQNRTVVDWKTTGLETMVDVSGLFLDFENIYKVEVRATNFGRYTSHPVAAGLVVYNEPLLTGQTLSFERTSKRLAIDWGNVFYLDKSLPVKYDVTIGTCFGFSDLAELRQFDGSHYEISLPTSTLVTSNVTDIFISITCTQITGLFNVYNTEYKL